MSWSVTTPPTDEPITLDEAKLHLRVSDTTDDTLITTLIQAAREHVEDVCERALMPQTWTERRLYFPPTPTLMPQAWTERLSPYVGAIKLRGGRVTAITSITYTDSAGTVQTLDPATYVTDFTTEPATILPVDEWPDCATDVVVPYQVGYADAASVPAAIKAAMMLIIGNLYANREGAGQAISENPTVARLLLPYKRVMP